MTRLALIRAEIKEISHRLEQIAEEQRFHPWLSHEPDKIRDRLRARLRDLRQQEFMLKQTRIGISSQPMPLFRQNGSAQEEMPFVLAALIGVAMIGVIVAMTLAALGALA